MDIAQLAHDSGRERPDRRRRATIKAGILEIADVLVVNKADQPGAPDAVRALRGMLSLARRTEWNVPSETVAVEGKGVDNCCRQ